MNQTTNINQIIKKIRAVGYALDNLEVKGRQNMDILLGSIQELDRVAFMLENSLREMEPPKVPDPTDEEENDSK